MPCTLYMHTTFRLDIAHTLKQCGTASDHMQYRERARALCIVVMNNSDGGTYISVVDDSPIAVVTPHSRIIGRKQQHNSPCWRRLRLVSILNAILASIRWTVWQCCYPQEWSDCLQNVYNNDTCPSNNTFNHNALNARCSHLHL